MAEDEKGSWLARRAEGALKRGFTRAYDTVKVDPRKYLLQLQAAHGLPISGFKGVFSLELGALDHGGFCLLDVPRGFLRAMSCSWSGRKTDCGYLAVSQFVDCRNLRSECR